MQPEDVTYTPSEGTIGYLVNLTHTTTPWIHYWSKCVGSSHFALTARADYRAHLQTCAEQLGFEYVRGHGLFDDDTSVSLGPGVGSYVNVDSFVDFLLSINMKV